MNTVPATHLILGHFCNFKQQNGTKYLYRLEAFLAETPDLTSGLPRVWSGVSAKYTESPIQPFVSHSQLVMCIYYIPITDTDSEICFRIMRVGQSDSVLPLLVIPSFTERLRVSPKHDVIYKHVASSSFPPRRLLIE